MYRFISLFLLLSIAQPITKCLLEEVSRSINRPEKDASALSPTGHFMVHYDIEGDSAPELTDINANGIPDYVDEVGIIADSTRKVLTEVMNFRPEVDDSDGIYDIYIMAFGTNYYGVNVHEGGGQSYIKIDNDYASGFYTTGIQVMRLTVAHEFFHAIQRAYKETQSVSDQFFYELTSTWIEDIIVPDGDDYLYWLSDFINNPQRSWDETDGYSLALFGHYLSTQFEDIASEKESTIMRKIWENISNTNSPYEILNGILQDSYNSSFQVAWLDFVSRNMFNDIFIDMENDIFYHVDQTSELCTTPPVNSTFMNSDDIEQFNMFLDNKSVQILSIASRDDLVIQLNVLQSSTDYLSDVLLFKVSQNEYFIEPNLQNNFNIKNIYKYDNIKFLYIGDGDASNIDIQVEANLQFCNDGLSEDAVIDQCGICGGNNLSCTDCNGYINGEAFIDGCGDCVGGNTGVDSCPDKLVSIYPNPIYFGDASILELDISATVMPQIIIYNLLGTEVVNTTIPSLNQGRHGISFSPILSSEMSSGVYVMDVILNNRIFTRKFSLIK
tara:strand:+ start:105 stop:1769 length:1665 start_codon:yes stop_codon:yes gene_type:complete